MAAVQQSSPKHVSMLDPFGVGATLWIIGAGGPETRASPAAGRGPADAIVGACVCEPFIPRDGANQLADRGRTVRATNGE
jgi:hypothetical protein